MDPFEDFELPDDVKRAWRDLTRRKAIADPQRAGSMLLTTDGTAWRNEWAFVTARGDEITLRGRFDQGVTLEEAKGDIESLADEHLGYGVTWTEREDGSWIGDFFGLDA